jgi:hypothetical protein
MQIPASSRVSRGGVSPLWSRDATKVIQRHVESRVTLGPGVDHESSAAIVLEPNNDKLRGNMRSYEPMIAES